MSMIESVRVYFCGCPLLRPGAPVRVDFLGDTPVEYAIRPSAATPVVRPYADGGALKQFVFSFESRETGGGESGGAAFCEALAGWLAEQGRLKNLPVLDGGKRAQKVEALSWAEKAGGGALDARYEMACRVLYYEN